MHETVTLHLGRTGCEQGIPLWSLLAHEHAIGCGDGMPGGAGVTGDPSRVFEELHTGKLVPRALFVDVDTSTTGVLTSSEVGRMLAPRSILVEPSNNSFGAARHLFGQHHVIDSVMPRLRSVLEACDTPSTIVLQNAVAEGFAAAAPHVIKEKLDDYMHKPQRIAFTSVPSGHAPPSTIGFYNAALGLGTDIAKGDDPYADLTVLTDADGIAMHLSDRCGIPRATSADDCDARLAMLASAFIAPSRLANWHGTSNDLVTGLSHGPRACFVEGSLATSSSLAGGGEHFITSVASSAAWLSRLPPPPMEQLEPKKEPRERKDPKKKKKAKPKGKKGRKQRDESSDEEEQEKVWHVPEARRVLSCAISYRGSDPFASVRRGVTEAIAKLNGDGVPAATVTSLSWSSHAAFASPTVTAEPSPASSTFAPVQRSAAMLSASSRVWNALDFVAGEAERLYRWRCYAYRLVGNGMEEGEIVEAMNNVHQIADEYKELFQQPTEEFL